MYHSALDNHVQAEYVKSHISSDYDTPNSLPILALTRDFEGAFSCYPSQSNDIVLFTLLLKQVLLLA